MARHKTKCYIVLHLVYISGDFERWRSRSVLHLRKFGLHRGRQECESALFLCPGARCPDSRAKGQRKG